MDNLNDWKEILAGAQEDERASFEWLADCERSLIKARERYQSDLRCLARIAAHVAMLEELSVPLEKPEVLQ